MKFDWFYKKESRPAKFIIWFGFWLVMLIVFILLIFFRYKVITSRPETLLREVGQKKAGLKIKPKNYPA